jgi:hypothetical protein
VKASRETILGASILAVLIVLTVVVTSLGSSYAQPALVSTSSQPDGALALKLWIARIGITIDEARPANFEIPKTTALMFVLQPDLVTVTEFHTITEWVSGGGSLIAAGDGAGFISLARQFGFTLQPAENPSDQILPEVPLLTSPPVRRPAPLQATLVFQSDKKDFVTLAAENGEPVIVMFGVGKGRVVLGSTAYPFTNKGLKEAGNPEMVLNLVAAAHGATPAWFDEWHHGLRTGVQVVGPENWLRYTPGGNALLFVVAVIFLALLLQGRSFGRPVPVKRTSKRRGSLEHLTAIANLNRRAGHRSAILDHYRLQVRRHLGQRYRLDPATPDEQFINTLARYNPNLDTENLRDLLKRLSQPIPREAEMVKLAAEASQWLEE